MTIFKATYNGITFPINATVERPDEEKATGFGPLGSFSVTTTLTLSKEDARNLARVLKMRRTLRQRRRRHSERALIVSVRGKEIGKIRGSDCMRDIKRSNDNHRRWIEEGRRLAKRDYVPMNGDNQ